jgi:DNA-binding PadR family transcriptional regulator
MNSKPKTEPDVRRMKLTTTSYALLALLDQLGEATSYDIKLALDKSIQNFWPVPHTTAYEEPARLADGGYLTVHREEEGRRRKTYALTPAGRRALREWADEPTASPSQYKDELMVKVFAGADPSKLVGARIAWHRAKIDEFEEILGYLEAEGGWERSERTVIAGLAYHRLMVQMIEELS